MVEVDVIVVEVSSTMHIKVKYPIEGRVGGRACWKSNNDQAMPNDRNQTAIVG